MAGDVSIGVRLQGDASGAVKALTLTKRELGQLEGEMKQAAQRTKKLDAEFQSWAASITAVGGSLAAAAGAVGLAGAGVVMFTADVIESTAKLDRQAEALGISAEAYQRLTSVYKHFGVAADQVGESMVAVADAAQSAITAAGSERQAFEALGISVSELRGKNAHELLLTLAEGFQNMDNKTRRAAIAARILGEDLGLELLPVLAKGADGIRELGKQAHVLGDDLTETAKELDVEFKKIIDGFQHYLKVAVLETAQFVRHAFTNNPSEQIAENLRAQIDAIQAEIKAGSATLADEMRLTRLKQQLTIAEAMAPTTMPAVTVSAPRVETGTTPTRTGTSDEGFFPMRGFQADVDAAIADQWLNIPEPPVDKLKETLDITRQLRDTASQVGNEFANSFADAIVSGESLRGMFQSLAQDITRLIVKTMVLKAVESGLNAAFPGAGSATALAAADGAVFDQQGVVPFAKGGIVTAPTTFPFKSGIGLMGEAGPEAIMPLTRLPGGDLGVKATGGGVTVQQNIHMDLRGADKSAVPAIHQAMQQFRAVAAAAVIEDLNRGGPISRAIRR